MKPLQTAIAAVFLLSLLFTWSAPAAAQSGFALEIFNTVNALRASRGLAPLTWDAGLEAYALEHCQYMVSTGKFTHVHSDGKLPWQIGIQENIASGTTSFMTAAFVVHTIWADEVHMKPMVGYAGGSVGVGVLYNGGNVIITLDMRPAGTAVTTSTPAGRTAAPGAAGTPVARVVSTATTTLPYQLLPRQTSTARPDGSQMHEVGYGQTLVTIAQMYGVSVDDIRRLNGIPTTSSSIWAGQKLLIRAALPTPSPTATLPFMPTLPTLQEESLEAPAASAPTYSPTQVSPSATPSPTPVQDAEPLTTRQVGLLALGAAALAAAAYLASQIFPRLRG